MRRRPEIEIERLADEQYELLRPIVRRRVIARLAGKRLDARRLDIESRYQEAWEALVQSGKAAEIDNLTNWLVKVTYNRALGEAEHQFVWQRVSPELEASAEPASHPDPARRVIARLALNQWQTSVRLRLSKREQRAIVLCHVLGYSRAETAEELGVSDKRLKKIVDEANKKLAGLPTAIEEGDWCEQHQSLMRAYALDQHLGEERRELAAGHLRECPGCASVVRSLRGLAAICPPVPLAAAAAGKGGLLAGALDLVRGGGAAGASGAGTTAAGGAGLLTTLGGKVAAVCAAGACAVAVPATVSLPGEKPAQDSKPRQAQRGDRDGRHAAARTAAAMAPVATITPLVKRTDQPVTGGSSPAKKRRDQRDKSSRKRTSSGSDSATRTSAQPKPAPASDDFVGGAPVSSSRPVTTSRRTTTSGGGSTSGGSSSGGGQSSAGTNQQPAANPPPTVTPAPDADVVIVP